MAVRVLVGDALSVLKTLPSESVQMVCTSPPYFQLRDYQTATWEGGSPECDHVQTIQTLNKDFNERWGQGSGQRKQERTRVSQFRGTCGKCGAQRIDQQIGMESSPAAFIAALMAVFDEVKRVLRPDGLAFVNLGDSMSGSGKGPTGHNGIGDQAVRQGFVGAPAQRGEACRPKTQSGLGTLGAMSLRGFEGIPPKSLMLIPERFAIAMQDAGWIVRSRIAWCKRSAMPESVKDRPTSAWEHVWMFSTSPRYFYDADAVRQPQTGGTHSRGKGSIHAPKITTPGLGIKNNGSFQAAMVADAPADGFANLRNYWLLSSEPNHDTHYAAYPTELVRRCILAGSRKGDTVLDPFAGSGTTLLVADRLGRDAIGIELNPQYAEMARRRVEQDAGTLFGEVVQVETAPVQASLFGEAAS